MAEVKQYTEFEKQTNGTWFEQHPKTDADLISGLGLEVFGVAKALSTDTLVCDAFMLKPLGICVINFDLRAVNPKPAEIHNHYFTVPEKYHPKTIIYNAGVGGIYGWGRESATTPRGTLVYRI